MIAALTPANTAPRTTTTSTAEQADAARADACRGFARGLPDDYLVYAVGDAASTALAAGDGPSPASPSVIDVEVKHGAQPIVLALGAPRATVWQLDGIGIDTVVGVVLSGVGRSTLVGLPPGVPVLQAARDDQQPCGYFTIDAADPQGANRFISRLLIHAVDGNYLPQGNRVVLP